MAKSWVCRIIKWSFEWLYIKSGKKEAKTIMRLGRVDSRKLTNLPRTLRLMLPRRRSAPLRSWHQISGRNHVCVCVGWFFKHILENEKCTVFQQISQCGRSSQQSERSETQHCSHYLLNQYLPDYVKYQPSKRYCATEKKVKSSARFIFTVYLLTHLAKA